MLSTSSFCSQLSEVESIERRWEIFFQHAGQGECPAASRTQALAHGSFTSVRDICFRCQASKNTVTCAYEEMLVESINFVVNIDGLGVYI